jgi:hypothetical protein
MQGGLQCVDFPGLWQRRHIAIDSDVVLTGGNDVRHFGKLSSRGILEPSYDSVYSISAKRSPRCSSVDLIRD